MPFIILLQDHVQDFLKEYIFTKSCKNKQILARIYQFIARNKIKSCKSFRHLCSRVMRVSMRPAHGAARSKTENDRPPAPPRVAVMCGLCERPHNHPNSSSVLIIIKATKAPSSGLCCSIESKHALQNPINWY